MQVVKIIGLLLVIGIATGSVVYQAQQLEKKNAQQRVQAASTPGLGGGKMPGMGAGMPGMGMPGMGGGGAAETLGNKRAKVVIEADVPVGPECHAKTLNMLRALAKEEPERVCVKIINHDSPEGQQLASKRGINCASVFINKEYKFNLQDKKGKKHPVEFHSKPNDPGSLYQSEDVIDVVNEKLTEAYGEGLDTEIVAKIKSAGEGKASES